MFNSRFNASTPSPFTKLRDNFNKLLVIQAALSPDNLFQIGGFTGIYGGRLGHCKIGRYCSIEHGIDVASDPHPTTWLSTSMLQYVTNIHDWGGWLQKSGYEYFSSTESFQFDPTVTIGNDVWIGQGAFIQAGVKIGDGAIVAARAVVVGDVPPYAVVFGSPATVKRMRFSDRLVERLMRLQWWRFNIMALPRLNFSAPESAIEKLEQAISEKQLPLFTPKVLRPANGE